jgi:hypothetical protein
VSLLYCVSSVFLFLHLFYFIASRSCFSNNKKLKLLGIPTLIITIGTPLMDSTRGDPITIASTRVAFSQDYEFNVRNMAQEIEECMLRS